MIFVAERKGDHTERNPQRTQSIKPEAIGKQVWRVVGNMHRELDVLFPISYPNYNR